jgi:hypothetical protein
MPTHESWDEQLIKAKAVIDDIASIDAKELGGSDRLGPAINFADTVDLLDSLIQFFRDLQSRSIERLCYSDLSAIDTQGQNALEIIKKIQAFELTQGNPSNAAASLKAQVFEIFDQCSNQLLRPLVFTATQATDYSKIEREAEGLLQRVQNSADAFEKTLNERNAASEKALAAIQKQAAEAGVSQNAIHFGDSAAEFAKKAHTWQTASIWMTVATVVAALASVLLAYFAPVPDTASAIQLALSKIVVVSVLVLGLVWCNRNHRAMKHNETLDRHRQNALATFRTFVEGTDNPSIKEAILLAAASSAFSARSTGFDGSDTDTDQSALLALDAVGRVMPKTTVTSG